MYEVGKNNGYRVGKNPCPACRKKGGDHAGDNFYWYGDGKGGYCWKCNYTVLSDEKAKRNALTNDVSDDYEDEAMTREIISNEENERIKSYTGVSGKGYRGIRDEVSKYFGVRYEYDTATGEPIKL